MLANRWLTTKEIPSIEEGLPEEIIVKARSAKTTSWLILKIEYRFRRWTSSNP